MNNDNYAMKIDERILKKRLQDAVTCQEKEQLMLCVKKSERGVPIERKKAVHRFCGS